MKAREIRWNFDGPEIFRLAVQSMVQAAKRVMKDAGISIEVISLVIPHQANIRILRAVAERLGAPEDKLFVNLNTRGNLSSASIPVAIDDAIGSKRLRPGAVLLVPAFGGGMTWSAHIIRWGSRVEPIGTSSDELPVTDLSALDIIRALRSKPQIAIQEPPVLAP
jgi:3-oxoacyl-[acyl-carrier-protein] synthase-3